MSKIKILFFKNNKNQKIIKIIILLCIQKSNNSKWIHKFLIIMENVQIIFYYSIMDSDLKIIDMIHLK